MNFIKLVPNVFYADINDALKLFINCLEFNITHDELTAAQPFCVVEKGSCITSAVTASQFKGNHTKAMGCKRICFNG